MLIFLKKKENVALFSVCQEYDYKNKFRFFWNDFAEALIEIFYVFYNVICYYIIYDECCNDACVPSFLPLFILTFSTNRL